LRDDHASRKGEKRRSRTVAIRPSSPQICEEVFSSSSLVPSKGTVPEAWEGEVVV
jgi:hypothetical protein